MVGLMVNPYAVGDHGLRLDCPSRCDQNRPKGLWLKKRWMVERTFGWLMGCRRLVRDYERLPESSSVDLSCNDSAHAQALGVKSNPYRF